MTERAAELVWMAAAVYALAGLLIALCAAAFGLTRLTETAGHMPLRVRLIILPGLVALWPLVLVLLLRGPAEQHNEP